MAKVTSKFQVTVPKVIAERYGIRPGDNMEWMPAGEAICVVMTGKRANSTIRTANSACLTKLLNVTKQALVSRDAKPTSEAGPERICTIVAALVDTNILVYRYDYCFPQKQKLATDLLRRGIAEDSIRVPHQAIAEFVAAVTRLLQGHAILQQQEALGEAEEFFRQFTIVYPNEVIVRNAIRGCATYQLNWFDAQI